MPPEPHRPTELIGQVFRGSDVVRRGLLTEHQLRSRAWAKLRQDVYADAGLHRDHALACRALALRLPVGALFAGPSAAYLLGVEHAASFHDDVHVIAPGGVRVSAQRAVRVHVQDLPATDITTARAGGQDLPCTTAARTAWDTAAWSPLAQAVPILDTMLHRRLLCPADLTDLLQAHAGRRGSRPARTAFGLTDPSTASPAESRVRVHLRLAGLPAPVLRHPVLLRHGPVLTAGLAWPHYRVAVQYHPDRARLLTRAGWSTIHIPTQERRPHPHLIHQVRIALLRAGWVPGTQTRPITLSPVPATTSNR